MELAEEDLEGLPDFVVAAARAAGEEKGAGGPVVTLSRSLIVPFLQFSSPRRDLREKGAQGVGGAGCQWRRDRQSRIAAETLALRAERAALLGYKNFAAYKLETEMAGSAERVRELLMAVWEPAKRAADADAACWKRCCAPMV
jgi:peptidyl-dipeptidase Dcp